MTTHSIQISAKALKEIGDFVQYNSFNSAEGKSDDIYILLIDDANGWGTVHNHDRPAMINFHTWK